MSMQTETRHVETRKPGMRKDTEITTTTVTDKSYAEVAAKSSDKSSNKTSSKSGDKRRASFQQQAQQMIPNVSKQQLAYGLPVVLAVLLSLLFLGFRSSSYFNPPPPPTMTQQFANKLDSLAHGVGGDYWEALKSKTFNIHQSVSELADSMTVNAPGLESLKAKANELKLEADKQYQAASAKSAEYAAQAKKAGVKGAAKAGIKVDNIKENGQDAYARAQLNSGGVAEDVKHAVNEATEAVRHAAAETQEALRHRAAGIQNAAQHKVQDVKEAVHNIKQTIKEHL